MGILMLSHFFMRSHMPIIVHLEGCMVIKELTVDDHVKITEKYYKTQEKSSVEPKGAF